MSDKNLTSKETQMLAAFIQGGIDVNGAETAEEMAQDNMTWMNADDLQEDLGWSKQEVGGVMSSLDAKNIIADSMESPRGAKCTDWSVNYGYLELGFSALSEMQKQAAA